jgi:polar amino acid transport system substrate-binding protein
MQHIVDIFSNNYQDLFHGLLITVELSLLSCFLATILGIILGVVASLESKAASFAITVFVDIVRGIPLLVLAFFIYYGSPMFTHLTLDRFTAAVIILTINAGAYVTEIVRGGIRAVSAGQKEAALAVGMTFNQSMRYVVLPQAFRIMLPNFVSQYIITLKDTTIISAIGLAELFYEGKQIAGRLMDNLSVYTLLAVFYLLVITLLTIAAKKLEKSANQSLS